jgi:hypothetical protein
LVMSPTALPGGSSVAGCTGMVPGDIRYPMWCRKMGLYPIQLYSDRIHVWYIC